MTQYLLAFDVVKEVKPLPVYFYTHVLQYYMDAFDVVMVNAIYVINIYIVCNKSGISGEFKTFDDDALKQVTSQVVKNGSLQK